MIRLWFKSGSPWIWLTAASVSVCLIMVIGVLSLVTVRGLGHFWPANVAHINYQEPGGQQQAIIGEIVDTSSTPAIMAQSAGYKMADGETDLLQYQLKTGNRDITGADFRWIQARHIKQQNYPENLTVIERREWGNFYGEPIAVKEEGKTIATGSEALAVALKKMAEAKQLIDEIKQLEKNDIGKINYAIDHLRLQQKKLELENRWDATAQQQLAAEKTIYEASYKSLQEKLAGLYAQTKRSSLVMKTESGVDADIPFFKIVRIYQPNTMSVLAKLSHYFSKVGEFLADDPREANTEGGIFPAIFGTIVMVLMMSVIVTPFGVIAAVYLREYAKQGFTTRLIRIAVNNLAGVPSVVYGVFGLGFFVYILGGNIDRLFFPEYAPAPVFGTPGLLWASITLALLTLPVVIVSTEEGLARIPSAIREGSLALGATKFETLWQTVLPMASPAMMTGLILAVARAAGEVAPLMLVGVVKLAPALPLDGNAPFLHLDRKFMHLGFHIYDVGFQSPNVEAARPLVYATSLLLVLVIVALNLAAIVIRNNLREKYRALEG